MNTHTHQLKIKRPIRQTIRVIKPISVLPYPKQEEQPAEFSLKRLVSQAHTTLKKAYASLPFTLRHIAHQTRSLDFTHGQPVPLIKSIRYMAIVNVFLVLIVVVRALTPLTFAERTSVQMIFAPLLLEEAQLVVTPHLESRAGTFISDLKSEGLHVTPLQKIQKDAFTEEGVLVSVSGDSIGLFEYTHANTARAEAFALAQQSKQNLRWGEYIHVYVKDSLVIYYMGNKEIILNALTSNAGEQL